MKAKHIAIVLFLSTALFFGGCALLYNENQDTSPESPTQVVVINPDRPSADPVTFYVRPDGGSASQCTGLADAPYSESGGRDCAWAHPLIALPPDGPARIQGSDSLIIAQGSYMMGYGAPGAEACDADYPWDCYMTSIPSGQDASRPTRILGAGWDAGCDNPPQLWGTERTWTVLNLRGSSFVEVSCFDITDHASCAEDHTGGYACQRNRYPYGEWAQNGVTAEDAANVHLQDLDVHGLASAGIRAGRLHDWVVERVNVTANGWVGWEGDIDGDDNNTGTLTFRFWVVAWNGCVETFPDLQPAGCWAQTAGGYGDGIGTGETGGTWVIEDSAFLHNTSDGLDLLYTRRDPTSITLRRVMAAGNAGNQIKTNGPATIENSVIVGNCDYFEDQPFTHHVDTCRAAGNALSFYLRQGNQVVLNNNTIASAGDCLVLAECDIEHSNCDGSESVHMRNNIFYGYPDINDPSEYTCLTYAENFNHNPFDIDYSIITHTKSTPPCPGTHDLCEVDPGLTNSDIEAFDGRLTALSPAIDSALPEYAPADDYTGRLRDDSPDIGAYEMVNLTSRIYMPWIADYGR